MKHHQGNTTYIVILFLILAGVAGAGWYFYSDEIKKSQFLVTDLRSEQTILITKQQELTALLEKNSADKKALVDRLQQQQDRISLTSAELGTELDKQQALQKELRDTVTKITDEKSQLLVELEALEQSQIELSASLEQSRAEKQALEAKRQQEISKALLTTTELEAELEEQQALQKQLRDTIAIIDDEKLQLLVKLETQKKSRVKLSALQEQTLAEKQALETRRQQEISKVLLTTAELEAELKRRQSEQESLHDEIATVSSEKSQLLAQLEQEQQSKKQIANLKSRLEQELNESRVEISQLKDQMTVIKLTSEVLFNSGSAAIKPAGKKVLSIIAESLNAYPDRAISIEGHTDNRALKQNSRYVSNWELSAARSLAAVYHLQQNNQVDPKRLSVVGYGEFRPVADNETAEGRTLNRRIEIRLLPPS